MTAGVPWNGKVRFIISDVDETVADVYRKASPNLVKRIEDVLSGGRSILFISGQGKEGIHERITGMLEPALRQRTLVGGCLGAEVWGFGADGRFLGRPLYSLYDALTGQQKRKWREIVGRVAGEFSLRIFPPMPFADFKKKAGGNPRAVMLADRGAQITLEVVNKSLAPGIPDMRVPIARRLKALLSAARLPVRPTFGGAFALDMRLAGASKGLAVRRVVSDERVLSAVGLSRREILPMRERVEVWGDRFEGGGVDSEISRALPPAVRSIDFRAEDPARFPKGRNIVLWDGRRRLHDGLLQYLSSRQPRKGHIN